MIIRERHLRRKGDQYYWEPSKSAKALGFRSEALGGNAVQAVDRARALNRQLDMERLRKYTAPVKADTIAWLIGEYQKSPGYKRLADKTRLDYDKCLNRISAWAGDCPVDELEPRAINAFYSAEYEKAKSQANAILRVLRILLSYGIVLGSTEGNAARKVKIIGVPPRDQVWADTQIDAFIKVAPPSMGLAVRIAADTGQREGDILTMPWSSLEGGRVSIRQSKRGRRISVPILKSLDEMLARTEKRAPQVVVTEANGRPYKEDHFRHEFRRYADLAGLPKDLQFRDLRRTAVVHLGRAGCTVPEIAAFTGWSKKTVAELLDTYLPNDGEVADHAAAKVELYRSKE